MPRGDHDKPGRPTNLPARSNADDWLGVFKTIDDVPKDYHLSRFESELEESDPDPFDHYLEFRDDLSRTSKDRKYGKAYRDLRSFMSDRGRHPACPVPDDFDDFFELSKDGEWASVHSREWITVVDRYLRPLYRTFDWFVYRTDYPHLYNPLLMAANSDGMAREAWKFKMSYDKGEYYE